MSTRPCLGTPGHTCGNTVTGNRSRCTTCQPIHERARRPDRPTAHQRGYDAAYRRERTTVIGGPCTLRLPGCTGTATTAHHVDGVATSTRLTGACAHCNSADGAHRSRGRG